MKKFRCGDVVAGCTATFEAGDEASILAAVASHAQHDHAITEIKPELVSAVRAAITTG